METNQSEWAQFAALTARLDELRSQLDVAEDENRIRAIYALEELIAETEVMRERLLSRLQDRVADGPVA